MKEKGFTAIEMIITLFVVAAAFVLITTMYASATRLTDRSEDLLVANSIVFQKLQQYENKAFEDIPPRVPPVVPTPDSDPTEIDFTNELPESLPGPREAKIKFSAALSSPTLKYIFISVRYQSANGQKVLEYGSLVQSGGLGR